MPTPPPRQIDSWQAAEENAAAWMRHLGFHDARVTQGGADGGIDVWATGALAQVKWEAMQTGTPALQRLVGARRLDHHKQLLFFSGAGYSAPAVDYADAMGIALLKYDLNGHVTPIGATASGLLERSTPPPPPPPHGNHARFPSPAAAPARQKLPGRGWWGRNWTIAAAVLFAFTAISNGFRLMIGRAAPDVDWFDAFVSLFVAGALYLVWSRSALRRQQWRVERAAALEERSQGR